MERTIPALALALAGCLAACRATTAGLDEGTRASVAEEVRAALREFEAAERARDVEDLLATLSPDFYMYVDGQRVDHETTVAQISATMPALRSFEPRFEDVEVLVLSQDAAVTSMVFRDTIVDATGTTSRMWGPSTLVWSRTGDGWKIVFGDSDHYPEPE